MLCKYAVQLHATQQIFHTIRKEVTALWKGVGVVLSGKESIQWLKWSVCFSEEKKTKKQQQQQQQKSKYI